MAQGIGFFIAGFETSSNTMSTLCYNLAVNEEVQEKLYQEICSVIEGKSRVRILYDHFTTLGLVFRFGRVLFHWLFVTHFTVAGNETK